MCGILGKFRQDGAAAERINLDLLSHRGPDSRGEWRSPDQSCWLGHTRLAILDLSEAGRQPMTDASSRFVTVFNGEIYNHSRLRASLPVDWRGGSDTETLVNAWAIEGAACAAKLKGMFAFVVYDTLLRELWAARDRFGIKPFYYRATAGEFSFASETRALAAGERLTLNPEALEEYLCFGRMPNAGEIGSGIQQLPPGHVMKVGADGLIRLERFWPPESIQGASIDKPTAVREVRRRFESSVSEHLLSDVPVGSFLSGGLDSSIVTALAAKEIGGELNCFSVGFHEAEFDECAVAREVAEKWGVRHEVVRLSVDEVLEYVTEAMDRMDLPSVDAVNTYIVSRAVSDRGIKVALSGLGGDELFGGYPSFKDAPRIAALGKIPASWARFIVRLGPRRVAEKFEGLDSFTVRDLARARRRFFSGRSLARAGLSPWRGGAAAAAPVLPDAMSEISWQEMDGYMTPMLLRDSDQMSMAVGLELRVPFLDHEFVEFVLSLPAQFKKGSGVKPLAVEAFADLLPRSVYDRPKMGFALPMDSWIRGPLRGVCAAGLEAAAECVSEEFVNRVRSDFEQRRVHWTRLWLLAALGRFLQRAGRSTA